MVIEKSSNERGQFASEATKCQTEKALEEHDKLVKEKKKLMKYIVVNKSKNEKEMSCLQSQLSTEKERATLLPTKFDEITNSHAEAENTSKHLRKQLETAFGKVSIGTASFELYDCFKYNVSTTGLALRNVMIWRPY